MTLSLSVCLYPGTLKMDYNEGLSVKLDDMETIISILNLFQPDKQYTDMLCAFYGDTIDHLKVESVCQNCRGVFSRWTNMGLRGCRTHPGRYADSTWECCNTMTSLKQYEALSIHQQQLQTIAATTLNKPIIYKYETPGKIAGCVAADHFTMADQKVITDEQYNAIERMQTEYQRDQTTFMRLDQLLTPHRLTTSARIEIPLLIFLLLPNIARRRILYLVCKVPFSITQDQAARQDMTSIFNVNAASTGLHPFEGTEMERASITLDSNTKFNLADIFVYISRVDSSTMYLK